MSDKIMKYLLTFTIFVCSFTSIITYSADIDEHNICVSYLTSKLLPDIKWSDFAAITAIYKLLPLSWTYAKNDNCFIGASQGICFFPPKALELNKDFRIGFLLLEHRTYIIIPSLIANLTYKTFLKSTFHFPAKVLGTICGIVFFPLSLSLVCLEYKCVRLSFFSISDLIRLCCVLTLTNDKKFFNTGYLGLQRSWFTSIFLGFHPNKKMENDFSDGSTFSTRTKLIWVLYTIIPRISIDLAWWLDKNKK